MAIRPVDLSVTNITATSVRLNWVRWTPLQLFLAGEKGFWFDPSDLSTLFQDAAGTIPVTADGDPVGLMLDKSGNGNHASQSISASRLIYRTDGTLHWLQFNGVNNLLVIENFDLSGTDKATLIIGLERSGSGQMIVEYNRGNNGTLGFFNNSSTTTEFFSGGTNTVYVSTPSPTTSVVTAVSSISENIAKIKVNSGSFSVTSGSQGTGGHGVSTLVIGGRENNTLMFNGKLFNAVLRNDETIDSELLSADEYIAAKSGVIL